MSSVAVVQDTGDWREAIASYYPRVQGWFTHVLVDRAAVDDLTQEVFVRLYHRLDSRQELLNPWNYIKVVARNVFMEHLQAQKKQKLFFPLSRETALQNSQEPDELCAQEEVSEAIPRLLAHLPVDQRYILVGRYFLGLTLRELAKAMGLAASTILERHNNAVCQLRELALIRGITL